MTFITGDIHGGIDIGKLSSRNFPIGKTLTRSDYVIICGDFGLLWDDSSEEHYWRKWLDDKPWTTLWIDGNHENFDMLGAYPIEAWHGGRVQRITPNILHLCRGDVFAIDGRKFFAFGGAESHDKERRKLGISLWEEELPSAAEMEYGRHSLETNGMQVNYVITHTLPKRIQSELQTKKPFTSNRLTDYFDEIADRLQFRAWFSGHYHTSQKLDRFYAVYQDIWQVEEDGTLKPANSISR